jgi:MerR family transcriptional regulator, copper efflux regulator
LVAAMALTSSCRMTLPGHVALDVSYRPTVRAFLSTVDLPLHWKVKGYRSYDQAALGRLGFVRAAQAVGLTLGEIRQIIAFRDNGQAPCAHVSDLLQGHAADLDARIRELQQLRGELRQLAERASTLDPEDCPPERVCHIIT